MDIRPGKRAVLQGNPAAAQPRSQASVSDVVCGGPQSARLGAALLVVHTLAFVAPPVTTAEPPKASQITDRELSVLRITPGGQDVPAGREIVIQFDRPVVPLGRMQRESHEVPVTVEPDPGCAWRWLDRSALACQLDADRPLPPATRFRLTIDPSLIGEDGSRLKRPHHHSFVTQRPTIAHHRFRGWTSPGTPEIQLVFDQPVDGARLDKSIAFATSEGDMLSVRVTPSDDDDPRYWLLRPVDELPLGSDVRLTVRPGVRPLKGDQPGIEDRVVVAFETFPEHRFLGVGCRGLDGEYLRISADSGRRRAALCDPLAGAWLIFTSPIIKEVMRDHLVVLPDLAGDREDYDPWQRLASYSSLEWAPKRHEYSVPLPEMLRADQEYRLLADAQALRDEFDRPLASAIDFTFRTDHRKPRLDVGYPISVLERGVSSRLPVVVTNLDRLRLRLNRLRPDGTLEERQAHVALPDVPDIAFRHPLPLREWLDGASGAVAGEIVTEPPTRWPEWFFAQVTPFHVHVKFGHYNTLVWVTDLKTGRPVKDARVQVSERVLTTLQPIGETLCEGLTDRQGVAVLPGAETLDPAGERVRYWSERGRPQLVVQVERGDELGLVPLDRDFRVQQRAPDGSWVRARRERRHGHLRAWGTTAQGIYRAGDTVQYKIYVRNEDNTRLVAAPEAEYELRVVDPLGKVTSERGSIQLSRFGAFDGELTIPESAAVGWYRFELRADFADDQVWFPIELLVTDFTPAPFRVRADLNGDRFSPGDRVRVSTQGVLHSGGPYVDAQARISATLRGRTFRSDAPAARGFQFPYPHAQSRTVHQGDAVLDSSGEAEIEFELLQGDVLYGTMTVESAVRDDRGKFVASRTDALYLGRDRFVGVRQPDWVLESGRPAELKAIVTDAHGEPVSDVPIELIVERRVTRASRVKGAGNAYLTHYTHSWEPVERCEALSGEAASSCSFTPPDSGRYRLAASIRDSRNRPVRAEAHRWATGPGAVIFEQAAGHDLRIEPEKSRLQVGDRARLLVHNPYPGARALITVERLGIMRHFVRTLRHATEVIELPVKPDDVPGFYVSVVIASPRVAAAPASEGVDLGKPAFRMGYAELTVDDPVKQVEVDVRVEPQQARPGDSIAVRIRGRARGAEDTALEYAVAVVDESVIDLIQGGARRFDPYRGFYSLGPLDLWNFNLLKKLIGIQQIEKKGANPGGGGSPDSGLRDRFSFLTYWNPSVLADNRGRASVSFDVPDNLTGWRVLVLAVTAGDRMGLGQATFRVNRPTEVRPALPNQVVEGDRFEARFTVMNRTDRHREIEVSILAEGPVAGGALRRTLSTEPYRRYTVALPLTATEPGTVTLTVRAGDSEDTDRLRVSLPVRRRQALEVAATYGSTTGSSVEELVQFPEAMRDDVGRISVVTAPSVIGGLESAFEYMRDYPYVCWEQRLSKAVMAAHYLGLHDYLAEGLDWPGSETLTQLTLDRAANFQAPNGGMVYFTPRDAFVSPYLSAYTALAFGWLQRRGYDVPHGVNERLYEYLLELVRRDVFPDFYTSGMASSVRAVALAALAEGGTASVADVERYLEHAPRMSLFGRAHLLQALQAVEASPRVRRRLQDQILAHAHESGGKLVLTETLDDGFTRLLSSELRTSCAVLSALVGQRADALRRAGAEALPMKLVRVITQTRQQRRRWENTQENVFCMNALVDYAGTYEQERPDLTLEVSIDGEPIGRAHFDDVRQGAETIERRNEPGDPGRRATVRLEHAGRGRAYYAVRLFFSPGSLDPRRVNAGIDVRKELSVRRDDRWVRLAPSMPTELGELVRVDLYLDLPAARNFVVVDDPVPGGLEPINTDLATASTVDAAQAGPVLGPNAYYHRFDDWRFFGDARWSFHHREPRHDAYRFYSEYLPPGRYHLSYVAQAIAPGTYSVLPVHAEEMYDPDLFGRGAPFELTIEEASP